jgi:hypothetical protein
MNEDLLHLRELKALLANRRANAKPALANGGIGKTDEMKLRKAGNERDFDLGRDKFVIDTNE